MSETPLIDYAGLPAASAAQLGALVARHTTLAAVTSWAGVAAIEEIITQDEFTHDVLIPLSADVTNGLPHDRRFYLVYDTT